MMRLVDNWGLVGVLMGWGLMLLVLLSNGSGGLNLLVVVVLVLLLLDGGSVRVLMVLDGGRGRVDVLGRLVLVVLLGWSRVGVLLLVVGLVVVVGGLMDGCWGVGECLGLGIGQGVAGRLMM